MRQLNGFNKSGTFLVWVGVIALLLVVVSLIRQIQEQMVRQKQEETVIDGLLVTQNAVEVPYEKQEDPPMEDISPGSQRIKTNCDEARKIATLEPGETIVIRHAYFGQYNEKKNRCSHSKTGDAVPIYGARGKEILPRFKNDMPFPKLPGRAVIFYATDEQGNLLFADYIKSEGGKIELTNSEGKRIQVWMVYNYPNEIISSLEGKKQMGWDGSTTTLITNIMKGGI